MKLLIIEDTKMHQMAARVQFPEAVVANYDEAYKLLKDARPGDFSAILSDLHFKIEINRTIPNAQFNSKEKMDAIGTQMPFGLAFVLKGVELDTPVALVSDVDHHSDLVTGLLDMMGTRGFYPGRKDAIPNPKFLLLRDLCPKAKDMYWNGSAIVQEPLPVYPSPCNNQQSEDYWKSMEGKEDVKDWRDALRQLTELMQPQTASA
jgi:hypothetical protein